MLDAIEADILNLETTLEAAPAELDFASFAAADADEGLISFDAAADDDDEGFAAFEAAPGAAAGADAPDFTATTPPAPRETAQKTSPFEAAIAARRARSEAQTERSDPLAGARVSVQ